MGGKKMIKATVVLKTGQQFDTEFDLERKFTAESLTSCTVQAIQTVIDGVKTAVFVQGDNVAYVAVRQEE